MRRMMILSGKDNTFNNFQTLGSLLIYDKKTSIRDACPECWFSMIFSFDWTGPPFKSDRA